MHKDRIFQLMNCIKCLWYCEEDVQKSNDFVIASEIASKMAWGKKHLRTTLFSTYCIGDIFVAT